MTEKQQNEFYKYLCKKQIDMKDLLKYKRKKIALRWLKKRELFNKQNKSW
jgi:hypothetical protein